MEIFKFNKMLDIKGNIFVRNYHLKNKFVFLLAAGSKDNITIWMDIVHTF